MSADSLRQEYGEVCLEIVLPFFETLDAKHVDNVQLFGGIGSAALKSPDVAISMEDKTIAVPADALDSVRQYRKKGRKSLRDMDALVKTADDKAVQQVKEIAQETVGKTLVNSVFGCRPLEQLEHARRHPFLSLAVIMQGVSDRYIREEGGQIVEAHKALVPFEVPMDLETLETWRLHVGEDVSIPVPHPGTTVLNYLTRSISGLRHRDVEKLEELIPPVLKAAPEIKEWIIDGPGATQFDLARTLQTMREPWHDAQPLVVGGISVEPHRRWPQDLIEAHPRGFEAMSARTAFDVLAWEHLKSRVVQKAEQYDRLVTFWVDNIEPRVGFLVENKGFRPRLPGRQPR